MLSSGYICFEEPASEHSPSDALVAAENVG